VTKSPVQKTQDETPVHRIIRLCRMTELASHLGKSPSVLAGWKMRGKIPQEYWDDIIEYAASRPDGQDFKIEYRDFRHFPEPAG